MLSYFLRLLGLEWLTGQPRHVWKSHRCPLCREERLCEHGGCEDAYLKSCMICRTCGPPDPEPDADSPHLTP